MPDGKHLLGEIAKLGDSPPAYIRCHNLLTTGDGSPALKWGSTNAYTEDAAGKPIYDWTIVDRIFDTYHERGLRPYVQIGFMPQALSSHPQPYRHHWTPGNKYAEIFIGWTYPPTDYAKWRELARQWVLHSIEKYGKAEVEQWYWELWNEPDSGYWHGTLEEYCKLYDFTVAGVRSALPTARVGGPHVTGPGGERGRKFLRGFLDHCIGGKNEASGGVGAPIDFIAFHAKGSPAVVDGHVRMGIRNQLNDIDNGFAVVASYPQLKDKPIVIGESDPDGCAACPASVYPQNNYRSGTLYPAYTAAALARTYDLAAKHNVNLLGAVTWAFEFEDQPYFAGFRSLSGNGIDLPIFNLFRMLAKMDGQRIEVQSSAAVDLPTITRTGVRGSADVSALASLGPHQLAVLIWHYHDDALPGPDAAIDLAVTGLPAAARSPRLQQFRIDDMHSNAFTAWQRMGSPQPPTADQKAQLIEAGKLETLGDVQSIEARGGKWAVRISLPRQSVSLLTITW
jgi:xylan 1,4-beta-xylosidase